MEDSFHILVFFYGIILFPITAGIGFSRPLSISLTVQKIQTTFSKQRLIGGKKKEYGACFILLV